ncbi:MAG: hypothetical protein AVDCRST_MAG93-7122, partial [uncultured Chloroflexia bacterium]
MRRQGFYLIAVGTQALASAALLPVLTHNVSRSMYGLIALVAVYQQLTTVVLGLGLPSLVLSWEAGGRRADLQRGAAVPILAVGAIGTIAAAAAGAATYAFVAALGTLNALLGLVLSRAAARGHAGVWALLTIAAGPAATFVAAAAVLLTESFTAYLIAWFLHLLVVTLVFLRWANREWFSRVRLRKERERLVLSLP